MKNIKLSILIRILGSMALLITGMLNAQVGINTTTPFEGAALEIEGSNKGFIMTKVALTGTDDNTTITPSNTIGVMVYNTATAGAIEVRVNPGFYYWSGSTWRRFNNQGYTIEYTQSGEARAPIFDDGVSNLVYVTLPGLDTGNITVPFSGTYQIKVEGFYSAGDLTSTSGDGASQGSISLAMADGGSGGCAGGITSYPYAESFESVLGTWTQSTTDDFDWTRNKNGTLTGSTGPTSGSNGDWYMYTETDGHRGKQAILNSPCFNLTLAPAATFTFDYHMYGSGMGTLKLEISDDNGGSWTSLWSKSGNQNNKWYTESLNLSAYIGGSVQLRFNGVMGSNSNNRSDMAIDNIILTNTGVTSFSTLKETYITTSSKRINNTTVNNLAQSASIVWNIDLTAGVNYRFAVRGREWLTNNVSNGYYGKNTSGYSGANSIDNAQRGTMSITLIKQH